MADITETVKTIKTQSFLQGLTGAAYVQVDTNTLRIVKARLMGRKLGARGWFVNLDIEYLPGSDTYAVHYHHMNSQTFQSNTQTVTDIYFDGLGEVAGTMKNRKD